MIEFYCPKCAKRIEVADAFAGKSGKCEGCGEPITVPSVSQPPPFTGLDNLHDLPDQAVAPERIGAYGRAADKHWEDPAAKAEEERKKKAAEAVVPLPEVPKEIIEIVRARRRRNMNYLILALFGALVAAFFLLPILLRTPPPKETRPYDGPASAVERPSAPRFGTDGATPPEIDTGMPES